MDITQNQREIRGCKRRKLLVNDSADISQAQENQPNYFDALPDETHLIILKKVPQSQLDSFGLVCRRFNRIIEDRSLWKKVVRERCDLEPDYLEKLRRRQVQDLTLRNVTIPSPSLLPALVATQLSWSLKEVFLCNLGASPDDLALIFNKCKQLTKVHFEYLFVNNDVLVALSENKNLEILCLRFVGKLDGVVLGNMLKNLVKLQVFNLENYVDPALLNSICENLAPSLLHLVLTCHFDLLNDLNVADIVRNCPLLRSFKVSSGGGALTGRSTESLGNLKDLRILDILYAPLIPYEAFFAMAYEMESLEDLNIFDSNRNDQELRAIEELFGVNIIEHRRFWRVGTFNRGFGVVRFTY